MSAIEPEKKVKNIDIDYLFDNFDDLCEVDFKLRSHPKQYSEPKIIKNLCKVFETVADKKTENFDF